MPRPRLTRKIRFNPKVTYFKPRGVPMRSLEVIELSIEEAEALRLKNVLKYDQNKCAEAMKTSQSTFQRILAGANEKISLAITEGKAIRINKT